MLIQILVNIWHVSNLGNSQINEPVMSTNEYGHKENLDVVNEWFVLL